jgi:uncharacterized membrane protein
MAQVLYCGDATLATGACYLGGVLAHAGITFDYVPMDDRFPEGLLAGHRLILLSDYPSANFGPGVLERLAERVAAGTSLLMVGGWESFHGLVGNYQDSALAPVLPVECLAGDDRLNWPAGLIPEVTTRHPIVDGLPFDSPPVVCGCNRVKARADSTTVLSMRRLLIKGASLSRDAEALPLLVLGTHGRGRTGAFATDFAPHWVGGLVDWGPRRVKAQAAGGRPVEVGSDYVGFITRLVSWFVQG